MGPKSQPPSAVLRVMQKCSCQVSIFPDVKEISVFNANLLFLQTKQTVSTFLCSVGSALALAVRSGHPRDLEALGMAHPKCPV